MMDAPIVTEALRGMGLEGAIISVLMGVIAVLATCILFMYKRANTIYGYRLKERDTLTTALTNATNATKEHTRAMENRSSAISALADATKDQAACFEQLRERVGMQYEFFAKQLDRQAIVLEALAEANRVNAAAINENRRIMQLSLSSLDEIRAKIMKPQRIVRKRPIIKQSGE